MALSCYQLNGVLLLYVAICGVLAAAACVYVFVGAPFYDAHFAPRYFYPALGVDDVDDDDNDPPSVIELPLDDGDAARALLRRECKPYFWQKFNGLGLLHQRTLAMTALAYLRGGVVVHRLVAGARWRPVHGHVGLDLGLVHVGCRACRGSRPGLRQDGGRRTFFPGQAPALAGGGLRQPRWTRSSTGSPI